jgi:hypothetical protein
MLDRANEHALARSRVGRTHRREEAPVLAVLEDAIEISPPPDIPL